MKHRNIASIRYESEEIAEEHLKILKEQLELVHEEEREEYRVSKKSVNNDIIKNMSYDRIKEAARIEQIAKDAKWISENIGSAVAVEFLRAMEPIKEQGGILE